MPRSCFHSSGERRPAGTFRRKLLSECRLARTWQTTDEDQSSLSHAMKSSQTSSGIPACDRPRAEVSPGQRTPAHAQPRVSLSSLRPEGREGAQIVVEPRDRIYRLHEAETTSTGAARR